MNVVDEDTGEIKFVPVVFRSAFGYDTDAASAEAVVKDDGLPSLTVQSMSEDADINVIMQRFGIGQPLPQTARVPVFGDFTEVSDYRSALEAIRQAGEAFMELPPGVRAKFDNDPQLLLEFAADPDNVQELVKLGLGKEIQYGLREVARDVAAAVAGVGGGSGVAPVVGASVGVGGVSSGAGVGGDAAKA